MAWYNTEVQLLQKDIICFFLAKITSFKDLFYASRCYTFAKSLLTV